jgi:hypothetical protein
MKKIIVAILAVLYLSTSMGTTIYLHYCMGRLVDWSLWDRNSSTCSKCGMPKSHKAANNGCCKDEYKQLKIEKDQKLSQSFSHLNKVITEISFVSIPVYSISLPGLSTQEYPKNNAPPRSWNGSLHIINCVFRI